jgi:diguanylate cyclase (GGDEF)-like protein
MLYLALVVFGYFSYERLVVRGVTLGLIAILGLYVLLLTWRIAMLALIEEKDEGVVQRTELAFLLEIGLLIALQATGGIDSPIFPTFYLAAALMVYFLGFTTSALLSVAGLAALVLHGAVQRQLGDQWQSLVATLGFTLVFCATVSLVVRVPRERARRAQQTLDRLTTEAERLARERRTGLAMLSRDHLAKSDVGALLQIDHVLGELSDVTKRALAAHTCLVALISGEPAALVVRAVSSDEKAPEGYWGADLIATVVGEALSLGGTLRYERLDGPRERPPHREWGARPRSILAAPLIENNRVIGVIAADSPYEGHFGRDEERFIVVMARQVMAAITRERLYRDVSAERAEFAAFYDLIKKLGSSIDLDTVSRVILESVQDIVSYDYGLLIRVDHDAQTGAIEAIAGLPAEKWLDATFPVSESLIGWVIGSKTYLHYPNLRERGQPNERRRPVFGQDLIVKELGSLLCLPLIRQNFVTGLLVFGAKEPNAFTHYEIKILEVLAVQAAVSLENARVHAQMEQMATRDGLTGCFNHRYFQEWLDHELHRAQRMPIPISLVLCDIDHFKKFNDTYGHPAGDLVLTTVAGILRGNVRKNDLAARYGGEEFALVLLNTDEKNAAKFANRVRQEIAKAKIQLAGERLGVTISMGIATYPAQAADKAALIEWADKALYAAKQGGRNQVVHARDLV